MSIREQYSSTELSILLSAGAVGKCAVCRGYVREIPGVHPVTWMDPDELLRSLERDGGA